MKKKVARAERVRYLEIGRLLAAAAAGCCGGWLVVLLLLLLAGWLVRSIRTISLTCARLLLVLTANEIRVRAHSLRLDSLVSAKRASGRASRQAGRQAGGFEQAAAATDPVARSAALRSLLDLCARSLLAATLAPALALALAPIVGLRVERTKLAHQQPTTPLCKDSAAAALCRDPSAT